LNIADKTEANKEEAIPEKPKIRIDRYGNEIIPRAHRLKNGLKSVHKVTYIDSIHKENSTA
jgi:hypothetical protein